MQQLEYYFASILARAFSTKWSDEKGFLQRHLHTLSESYAGPKKTDTSISKRFYAHQQ